MASTAPNTFGGTGKEMDIFKDSNRLDEISKRHNKDCSLYPCYQINPYSRKMIDYTTRKVNEKKPKIDPKQVPGYPCIRENLWKTLTYPTEKKCHPETEAQRYGWFPQGTGIPDAESYDERFNFSHTTADFIKTQAAIHAFNKLMTELEAVKSGAETAKT